VEYDIERHARMPFADATFDVVINRHEAHDAREVARILKPGGAFLTQQVDDHDLLDLYGRFGAVITDPPVRLGYCVELVREAGLVVERTEEWQGHATFSDVGAVVFFLHALPWNVSDFSVDRYADALLALHRSGSLTFTVGRFVIQARRP
jgi:SAM-dependent methyltransferase